MTTRRRILTTLSIILLLVAFGPHTPITRAAGPTIWKVKTGGTNKYSTGQVVLILTFDVLPDATTTFTATGLTANWGITRTGVDVTITGYLPSQLAAPTPVHFVLSINNGALRAIGDVVFYPSTVASPTWDWTMTFTSGTIGTFYPLSGPALNVTLSGNTAPSPNSTQTYTGTVTGGTPPFQYAWWPLHDNTIYAPDWLPADWSAWTTSTTSTHTITLPTSVANQAITVEVADSTGATAIANLNINTASEGGWHVNVTATGYPTTDTVTYSLQLYHSYVDPTPPNTSNTTYTWVQVPRTSYNVAWTPVPNATITTPWRCAAPDDPDPTDNWVAAISNTTNADQCGTITITTGSITLTMQLPTRSDNPAFVTSTGLPGHDTWSAYYSATGLLTSGGQCSPYIAGDTCENGTAIMRFLCRLLKPITDLIKFIAALGTMLWTLLNAAFGLVWMALSIATRATVTIVDAAVMFVTALVTPRTSSYVSLTTWLPASLSAYTWTGNGAVSTANGISSATAVNFLDQAASAAYDWLKITWVGWAFSILSLYIFLSRHLFRTVENNDDGSANTAMPLHTSSKKYRK